MRTTTTLTGLAFVCALAGCGITPQAEGPTQRKGDFAVIDGAPAAVPDLPMTQGAIVRRVVRNGRSDNRVMDHLTTLTQTFGPRLTGSTSCEAAAAWARDQFASWGLSNVHLHHWGDVAVRFDRGPSSGAIYTPGRDGEPRKLRDLDFTTLSWTPGTDGPKRGPVVRMPRDEQELAAVESSLAGAWVLIPEEGTEGRSGVRGVGQMMRARVEQRHRLRSGADNPHDFGAHVAPAPADEDPNRWTGTYTYGGNPLPVWMSIDGLDGSTPLAGTLGIPGFHEGPISEPSYDPGTGVLTFDWKHEMGTSKLTLKIDGDTATGESLGGSGTVYPVSLTRGAPPADAPADPEDAESAASDAALARVLAAGPLGFVSSSRDDDRVWTTSKSGWREMPLEDYESDVEVNVSRSDYDYLNSRLADGQAVELEFDLHHTLTAGPIACHNVIAELQGDELPDEVVIVSAHLDSWDGPGSQGCVDNGTGSAVIMEAARLLAVSGVRPKRTIRFILWTGEEQGLLGSKAYVESLSPAHLEKISAAFVDDGGTNYQGGVPAADFMVPYLAAATAAVNGRFYSAPDRQTALDDEDPSNDRWGGYLNVNVRNTGEKIDTHTGSDHASFNRAGVPGFYWDEVGRADYRRGWHTQFDRLDLAIPEYLRQSATNSAVVALNLADAPTRVPRSPDEARGPIPAPPAPPGATGSDTPPPGGGWVRIEAISAP